MQAAGLGQADVLVHADELRVGLYGCVRRVLAPRGVKVRQAVEVKREWAYLVLAVDTRRGTLYWGWQPRMRSADVAVEVAAWREAGVAGVVWDSAPGHYGDPVRAVGLPRLHLPPYSPELNPAERLFEVIRDRIEGRVYGALAAKQAAVEEVLAEWAADPARVRTLCDWTWLHERFDALPE